MTVAVDTPTPLGQSLDILLWLDSDAARAQENSTRLFASIRHLLGSVKILLTIQECTDFLRTLTNKHVAIVITDGIYQQPNGLIKLIEECTAIDSVYIYSTTSSKVNSCEQTCKKLQGVCTNIEQLSRTLEHRLHSLSIDSLHASTALLEDDHPGEFDSRCIYARLLTEVIVHLDYNERARREAFDYCREHFAGNAMKLKEVDQFARDYQRYSPIWWYRRDSLVYAVVDDALITQNFDVIVKMGYFIGDLHREIKQLHAETVPATELLVYRAQPTSDDELQQWIKRKGDLHVFHQFLVTSTNRETTLCSARDAATESSPVIVLFEMLVDHRRHSVPYASLDNVSYCSEVADDVLFSTQSIFRITEITQLEDRLWQVTLVLTADMDEPWKSITDYVRSEIVHATSWHSLARLLHKMGQFEQALAIFKQYTEITYNTDSQKSMQALASTYNSIGSVLDSLGNYTDTLASYKRALEIEEKCLPPAQPAVATITGNIGMTYRGVGDYDQAFTHCEKALAMQLALSSPKHEALATANSDMGMIHESKGDYKTALSHYEKAYTTQQSSLPTDHPSLTRSYDNLAGIYCLTGRYTDALSYYAKTLHIQRRVFLSNHPAVATVYSNLGHVHQLLGHYSTSLSYYQKALKIQEPLRSSNPLSLAATYNNIGLLHRLQENYPDARLYYEKALSIEENTLKADHPSLAVTYNNLASVHLSLNEYPKALALYEKALRIWHDSLPADHPSIAAAHNNIGSVHDLLGDHQQALVHYHKTVDMQLKSTSTNPLDLAATYNNMGETYRSMVNYPEALSYYAKALEIEERHLSPNHLSLGVTLSNMAVTLDADKQTERALEHAERAFQIVYSAVGSDHPQTKQNQKFRNDLWQRLPVVAKQ